MVNNYKNFSKDLLSIYNSNPNAVEVIFQYGLVNGPINATDTNGNTLLHHVVTSNDKNTLTAILNFIQNDTRLINVQNNDLDTAMHIAVRNRNEEIAKLLDDAGANLRLTNKRGESIETSEEAPSNKLFTNSNKFSKCMSDSSLNLSRLDDSYSKFDNLNNIIVPGNEPMSESEVFVKRLADEISNVRSKLKMAKTLSYLKGGAEKNENESSFEIKFVSEEQNGGSKKSKSKSKSKRSKASRSSSNESSLIHDSVVEKFKKLGYSEDDARALKAGLYSMVKEQSPTLNNLERANEMLKLLENKNTLKVLENKMGELREIIANAKKLKAKQEKTVIVETKTKKSTKAKKAADV